MTRGRHRHDARRWRVGYSQGDELPTDARQQRVRYRLYGISSSPIGVERNMATTPRKRPGKLTRAQKLEKTRKALIAAAVEIIGEEGYQACSVSKIAARAKVGQGTFYTYFSSRQELFDQLLPEVGGELRDFIRERTRGFTKLLEFEEQSFDTFLEFLYRMPGYPRVFSEAETAAPDAFSKHMGAGHAEYVRALGRAMAQGEMPGYSPDELDVLASIFIALRSFVGPRYLLKRERRLPSNIRKTYLKFLAHGIRGK